MSLQIPTSSEAKSSSISALINELARPELAADLGTALGTIQEKMDALRRLSDLRATAKALLDLHQRVPYLQRATLNVAHRFTSDGSDFTFSLSDCGFVPGAPSFGKSVDELIQALEDEMHMPVPSISPALLTEPIDIFAYWPEMYFNAVLGEPTFEATATVETARDVVLEAYEAGGRDEIIRAVLPESWNAVATQLNLPVVPDDEAPRPRPRA